MNIQLIRFAAITLLSSGVACGADPEPPPPMMIPEDTCTRGALEADLTSFGPLAGPAVDPSTGVLSSPPEGGYLVSSTYLRLKSDPAAQMRFGELSGPISQALSTQPGLLAIELRSSESCGTARTFTVWASEEAMYNFVASPAHAAAMQSIGEISRGGSVATHWTGASLEQSTWEEAARRLAADDGPIY